MAVRPVVVYPHPSLTTAAAEIAPAQIDDDLRAFADDMIETMRAEHGVGLAANQVDVLKRIAIVDVSAGEDPEALRVMVNPSVLETSGSQSGEEGCLSFPDIFEFVTRPNHVRFRYTTLDGESVEEEVDGFFARAVVHEIDHLDGVVFTERMSPLKRRMVLRRIEKLRKLGEWPDS